MHLWLGENFITDPTLIDNNDLRYAFKNQAGDKLNIFMKDAILLIEVDIIKAQFLLFETRY
jgi:hypothetical protein